MLGKCYCVRFSVRLGVADCVRVRVMLGIRG